MSSEITSILASGQLARLIPTVADSKKEERATSTLLASFMVVPSFATSVLSDAGASIGKRSKITCYTEVVFKSADKGKGPRPDGLVVVANGSKTWTALIESKIGNAELTNDQVEEYLSLAKQYKINAVITISNQFATTPTHHPLTIAKSKTKSVELYHFSWLSLKSKAVLLTGAKGIDDPEQAYILSELVRYLDHDSSGITALNKMPALWKDLCTAVQNGVALNRKAEFLTESVSGWHQLLRHLTLNLSMAIGQPVDINLTRQREKDADLNFSEDCAYLAKESSLKAEFNIPNAASRLVLSADVLRKVINVSMKLEAPKDKSRATASINWLTRQLKGTNYENLSIRAYWPKRIPETMASLDAVLEDPSVLIPPNVRELPTYLEVVRVVDLGARFKGAKTFVEDVSTQFPKFYHDAGQLLTKWVAQAPKIKEKKQEEEPSIPTIFSEVRNVTQFEASDSPENVTEELNV
ncbi:hypothetical protein [uncultured Pseudoteredinibacter sp.]|uniref:hypothetical protein n=1 Tax=uncultured Pseudoteredinibacter sp. TaxID=1641701 RepID=UPI002622462C|nr:hypothetical protein [uncultured Pseudoteredinibacter sp.]